MKLATFLLTQISTIHLSTAENFSAIAQPQPYFIQQFLLYNYWQSLMFSWSTIPIQINHYFILSVISFSTFNCYHCSIIHSYMVGWWFGTSWAMSRTVKELIFSWRSGRRRRRRRAWNVVPLALMWVVQREREKQESFWGGRVELSFFNWGVASHHLFHFGAPLEFLIV